MAVVLPRPCVPDVASISRIFWSCSPWWISKDSSCTWILGLTLSSYVSFRLDRCSYRLVTVMWYVFFTSAFLLHFVLEVNHLSRLSVDCTVSLISFTLLGGFTCLSSRGECLPLSLTLSLPKSSMINFVDSISSSAVRSFSAKITQCWQFEAHKLHFSWSNISELMSWRLTMAAMFVSHRILEH